MPKCQFLFSAVFGFRNPSNEIFSESDEINAQVPIFPGTIQNTREPPEGSPGGPTPHPGAARGGVAPPYGVVAPGPLRGCPSAYLKPPSRKPYNEEQNPQKPSRAAAIAKPRSGGQESLFRHAAGTGKCPRKAPPSTPPPSSSTLLSPMRRE